MNILKKILTVVVTIVIFIFLLELIGIIIESLSDDIQDEKDFSYLITSNFNLVENKLRLFELSQSGTPRIGFVKVNSEGYHDIEHTIAKPVNTTRIVVIGDSITEGIGVTFNETYAKVLEKLLNNNSDNKKFEVINFGLARYSIVQYKEVLKMKAMKYDPDIIVIGYFLNDPLFEEPFVNYLKEITNYETDVLTLKESNAPIRCWTDILTKKLALKSSFFDLITKKTRDITKTNFYENIHSNICSWSNVVSSFKDIKDMSEPKNIPVYLVIFPLIEDLNAYPFEDIHTKVSLEAEKNGFTVIDLLDNFKSFKGELKSDPSDNIHPNKEGHLIVANRLYEEIMK